MRPLIITLFVLGLAGCQTGEEARTADSSTPKTEGTTDETEPTEPNFDTGDKADAAPNSTQAEVPKATHGAEIYARVCVTCHGKTGDGRGLEQELFSFGAPAEKWENGPTTEGIMKTLQDGIHQSSMKSFDTYSEGDRRAVALYVLDLRERLIETREVGSFQKLQPEP